MSASGREPVAPLRKCPLCRRGYYGTEGLLDHLLDDHSSEAVADELLRRVYPPTADRKCAKKQFTRDSAERALLLNATLSMNPLRKEQRSYRCDSCHTWHLTSQDPRT